MKADYQIIRAIRKLESSKRFNSTADVYDKETACQFADFAYRTAFSDLQRELGLKITRKSLSSPKEK